MPWPKVEPGDKLRIPAGLHNATVEAVEAYLRHKTATGGTMGRRAPTQALVLVSNDTGADLAIGGVVGLDGPIWPGYNTDPDPGTAGEKFFLGAELVFSGIEPTAAAHTGRFAVAVEPILNGAAGRACVQGVVKVKVQIDDLNVATWADVTDAESGYLTATASGSARILWHEGDVTGTLWCICLLGARGVGGSAGLVEPRSYALMRHIGLADTYPDPTFGDIADISGCYNSMVWLDIHYRHCPGAGTTDDHPQAEGAPADSMASALYKVGPTSCLGVGDDTWHTAQMFYIDEVGNVGGWAATKYFQFRIGVDGRFQVRAVNTGNDGAFNGVVMVYIKVVNFVAGMDMQEAGDNEYHESAGDPAWTGTWGDSEWEPGTPV